MPKCIVEWNNASAIVSSLRADKNFPFKFGTCAGRSGEYLQLAKMDKNHTIIEKLKEAVYSECKILNHLDFHSYYNKPDCDADVLIYLHAVKQSQAGKKSLVA
jgi:hypothetical protein